ncbi:MAG: hypothetical protein AB8U25_04655 [Rickettsiales endosymbiont of Dermacentor nuttalli]
MLQLKVCKCFQDKEKQNTTEQSMSFSLEYARELETAIDKAVLTVKLIF